MNFISVVKYFGEVIGTGIISGVFASLCYAGLKKIIRPKIDIAPYIIVHPTDKTIIVKYINRTKSRLVDVSAKLYYYNINGAEADVREIPSKTQLPDTLSKFVDDSNDINSQSLYAVQAGFLYNPETLDFSKEDKLTVMIKAVHPLSGTVKYFPLEFHCDENNADGEVRINDILHFCDGNNMKSKTY